MKILFDDSIDFRAKLMDVDRGNIINKDLNINSIEIDGNKAYIYFDYHISSINNLDCGDVPVDMTVKMGIIVYANKIYKALSDRTEAIDLEFIDFIPNDDYNEIDAIYDIKVPDPQSKYLIQKYLWTAGEDLRDYEDILTQYFDEVIAQNNNFTLIIY